MVEKCMFLKQLTLYTLTKVDVQQFTNYTVVMTYLCLFLPFEVAEVLWLACLLCLVSLVTLSKEWYFILFTSSVT